MPISDTFFQVKIGDIQLRNPTILSPGPCGRSPASMKQYADAVVTGMRQRKNTKDTFARILLNQGDWPIQKV